MIYTTLENTPSQFILDTFNQAFSDYINPTPPLSEKVFDWKMQRDGTEKHLSPGMFSDAGELVGFILHASGEWKGKKAVYNGGTGIIPGQRGHRGTRAMYAYILPILQEMGIEGIVLECIMGNEPAMSLYQKLGFQKERELICYMGNIQPIYMPPPQLYWQELDKLDWPYLQTFWDSMPSWQNSSYAVERIDWSYRKIGLFTAGTLIGYGIMNPLNGYIPQFGIHPDYRRQGFGKFLFSLLQSITERQLALINVDEASPSIPVFVEGLGMRESLRQIEFWLPLAKT